MSLQTNLVQSNRLNLILLDSEALQYSLVGEGEALQNSLGLEIPPEWFAAKELIEMRYQQIDRNPNYQPWSLRAIVLREQGRMIGHIGFHTPPGPDYLQPYAENGIEFGFTIYHDFRRNGYAGEAAAALMGWAHEQHGISEFILTIRPDNVPSLKIAERLGFKQIGSHVDEVDGLENIYKLTM